LSIVERSVGREPRLSVSGEIDLTTAPILERALQEAESLLPRRIVLELSALQFIDSSGLHALCAAHARAEQHGRALVLENVPAHVRRLLGIAGMDMLLSGPDQRPRLTA
jgi:anti-anti-sigma factor